VAKYSEKDKKSYLKYYKSGGKVPFGKWLMQKLGNKGKTGATLSVQDQLAAQGISSKEMPSDIDKFRKKKR